jgi:hypothetical protein
MNSKYTVGAYVVDLLLSSMINMMMLYSVLSISRWSVVTLHPLLKASPQKLYSRHTESVDKYGVSISTGAPGPCSRFWKSPSCLFTFSFMCIFFLFHMCFSLHLSPISLFRLCPLTHEFWISL